MKGCGTFVLTEAEKQALWESAKAQKAERDKRLPDEAACLRAISDGVARLKDLGWREAIYAPANNTPLELIEAGSTGIHRGYRDDERRFWIVDDDTWPSHPILYRLASPPEGHHE